MKTLLALTTFVLVTCVKGLSESPEIEILHLVNKYCCKLISGCGKFDIATWLLLLICSCTVYDYYNYTIRWFR